MIRIDGKTFNSRDFKTNLQSMSDEYKKNDKKIASDNITVQPLEITAFVFYAGADYKEAIEFLEEIVYSQKTIDVTDLDLNKTYSNMYINKFEIEKIYPNSRRGENRGFTSNITFGYIPITQTAIAGQNQYTGYSINPTRVNQRSLLSTVFNADSLPTPTLETVKSLGKDIVEGNITLETLDFDRFVDAGSELVNYASQKIQTSIGEFTGIFELGRDGTFNIYDSLGKPLSMGQKILTNVELLANTIPGVDISIKLIPLTNRALNSIFEVDQLGKDFFLNVAEVKKDVEEILGG